MASYPNQRRVTGSGGGALWPPYPNRKQIAGASGSKSWLTLSQETSEKCLAISKVLSVVAETLLDIDEVVALCPLMQHFCRHQQHGDYLNALLFSFLPTSWTQGMNQFFNLQWCCTPLAVGGQRTANTARGWRKARMGDD